MQSIQKQQNNCHILESVKLLKKWFGPKTSKHTAIKFQTIPPPAHTARDYYAYRFISDW